MNKKFVSKEFFTKTLRLAQRNIRCGEFIILISCVIEKLLAFLRLPVLTDRRAAAASSEKGEEKLHEIKNLCESIFSIFFLSFVALRWELN